MKHQSPHEKALKHADKMSGTHHDSSDKMKRAFKKAPTFAQLRKMNPRLKPDGKGNLAY